MRDQVLSRWRQLGLHRSAQRGALTLAVGFSFACQEPEVRPQVVLYVDIDLPVSSQAGPDVSPDAIVDSLRVDVYASDRSLIDSRVFSVESLEVLPIAFGIRSDVVTDGQVKVRLRAFRAALAVPITEGETPVLSPLPEVSVDRLAVLELPAAGVVARAVTLSGACIGKPIRFGIGGQPDRTCLDAEQLDGLASEGIEARALDGSVAGSSPLARVVACAGEAPEGALCVPGGFSVLGDPRFVARTEYEFDATPLVPLVLKPFFIDATEVTVGELRALIAAGYDGPLPLSRDEADPNDRNCTWDPAIADDLPVNCISAVLADQVCAARGGLVPSEAQWDYVARGRGERRLFAWGNSTPDCCSTNVGYFSQGTCFPEGPEPVASHPGEEGCPGDVSRDGVLDLNGSMSELVRDSIASYADDCWAAPGASAIREDPVCVVANGRISRGAGWNFAFGDAPLAVRRALVEADPSFGFRCVYESAP